MTTSTEFLKDLIESMPQAEREFFEERAAIAEHEGGMPRVEAEMLAAELLLTAIDRGDFDATDRD